jgi:hypothetical protein
MYSFLIRLGDKQIQFKNAAELKSELKKISEKMKNEDKDARYLSSSWNKMHTIIKHRRSLFPEEKGFHDVFFKAIENMNFHHQLGLRALCDLNSADTELNKRMKKILEGEKG